ncbi:hypothetical protein QVD17_27854 [Tagetes erecta]|uniref:Uncharacterized protein n=1 Tax=Tagetes erecta TaxID=13708 RepID=A0AAD8K9Z7_TARER|nr:hypothetical protein QVD17_27854 [Tagetes erecta]
MNYAEICFWEFGDRVKNWVTLNEPFRFTYFGYVTGISAPGRGGKSKEGDIEVEPYIVAYNLINCHASAYKKYQEEFKELRRQLNYEYPRENSWVMGYFTKLCESSPLFTYHYDFKSLKIYLDSFPSFVMAEEKNLLAYNYNHDPKVQRRDFPSDFMFGVGTSAYQIEGAWKEDGKGLHIWDCFALRHPENITDGSNACVTVDFYHKMKEDVQVLKKMGVNSFRFSISWSRILPGGKVSMGKSLEGINFYNKLIDELKANDIEPFVTLFHWDLPNALEEEYMGFLSPKIVDDFVNYAEICFWEYGDRVKNWVTLNEPFRFTYYGYVKGRFAPGRGGVNHEDETETEPYNVAYNLINCHAAAYKKYQDDFKEAQNGKVGITLDVNFFKPFSGDKKDVKAVEYAYDFMFGLFMEPITSGDWPKNVQKFARMGSVHYPQGRNESVIPSFTIDQKETLKQSYDFLGINYYTASFAKSVESSGLSKGFETDMRYEESVKDISGNYAGEPAFDGTWVFLCAKELVDLLFYIKKTYKVENYFVITENGAPEENEDGSYFDSGNDPEKKKVIKTYEQVKDDEFRVKYIKWHLEAIRRANSRWTVDSIIWKKHLVMGYFVWSFTDSYEWSGGYTQRFGLNYVDYKNNLLRYPKSSALWYKKFLSGDKTSKETHVLTEAIQAEDKVSGEPSITSESDRKKRKIKA